MDHERMKKRLTIRLPAELDVLLREEAVRSGMSLNQVMLSILIQQFHHYVPHTL